jgi:hypothetical protein
LFKSFCKQSNPKSADSATI